MIALLLSLVVSASCDPVNGCPQVEAQRAAEIDDSLERIASMIPGDYGYRPGQGYDTARFEREISRPAPKHPRRCPVWMRLRSGRIIGSLSSDPRRCHDGRIDTISAPKNWGRKSTKKQEN